MARSGLGIGPCFSTTSASVSPFSSSIARNGTPSFGSISASKTLVIWVLSSILLPILAVFTLGVTGLLPTLAVISVSTVIRRACEFAIGKPAREILFTVVSRQERYKAKNVIDTVVSRGSDVVSTWSHAGLRGLGMTSSQMAFAVIPLCFVMIGAGICLGRQQEARSKPDAGAAGSKVPASA